MEVMSTKEVAEYLGIKPGTVRKWRARYALPSYHIGLGRRGGTVIFRKAEVDAWLDEFKSKGARILV